ncbi:prohibitin family protein [Massilia sp. MS-15]|uniref:prohibitin family protein n=1 Tax=Massilia sp. MS-15 TaxID=2878200 RepID=UPI001CD591AF|nr:prohibitin family protein [Massilia sp. MS-15]MCA1246153.1 prohibitin family protein [Massilia sp. MS-15]
MPKLNPSFTFVGLRRLAFLLLVLVLLWIVAPYGIVPPGHRGIMTTMGRPGETVLEEGIHWKWPVLQRLHLVDVSIQENNGEGTAASADLQTVTMKVSLNYHVLPSKSLYVFRDLANAPGERIVLPAVHEAVKASAAAYTAEQLIGQRNALRNDIVEQLRARLGRHGIQVDEMSIMDLDFSEGFNRAIEAKATAEQEKLKAERDLARIQVEAQQKLASAKAEADALALQRQQVTPELLRLRETENQARAIDKWDGKLPDTIAGGTVPFLNLPRE